jgi:hypothetical protein
MLPVTAIQQIVSIPDATFTPYDVPGNDRPHVYLDLYPERAYDSAIIVAPHHHEAWLNVHLFKLALFCREHKIKLISIGHENQLPFFGMFSDAVILQKGSLDAMFGWFSTFSTSTKGFDQLAGWKDIYKHDDLPWDALPIAADKIPDARRRYKSPWRAIYGHYSAEHVIAQFSDCRIFLRESSLETFHALNAKHELPRNAFWCEVKEKFGKFNARLRVLQESGTPLAGLDKTMQRDLVRKHGTHFMALQILTTLFNNCRLLTGAGSSHVFAVAPGVLAMCIGAADRFYTDETEMIVRKMHQHRYGIVPYTEEATLTWMCADTAPMFSAAEEHAAIAHWQLDYFLDVPTIRAHLLAALAQTPKMNIVQTSWLDYLTEKKFLAFTQAPTVRFLRGDGAHLMDTKLTPSGRLAPASSNETFWTVIAERMILKTHLGQTATIMLPRSDGVLAGPFIYNADKIEHQFSLT